MQGDVDGDPGPITRQTAADTVFRAGRYPDFPFTYDRTGVEIDLFGIPDEETAPPAYWDAARRRIDDDIRRLTEGVRQAEVGHVSLFALARLPLLVYLGAALDDTFEVAIYQRHRSDESWDWKDSSEPSRFLLDEPADRQEEAVLLINLSGTIDAGEVPAQLRELPRFTLSVDGPTDRDVIASRASLASFEATVRRLFASLEAPTKVVRRLHVLAAAPVSAAITVGRAHTRKVDPPMSSSSAAAILSGTRHETSEAL